MKIPAHDRVCRECGKPLRFKAMRDFIRKFFCSKVCSARFHGRSCDMTPLWAKACTPEARAKRSRPGELNPRWLPVGTKRQVHNGGYVEIKLKSGWEYEHRVVANAPSNMHVHHKDENPQNNNPANLQLMTHSEHSRLHKQIQRWSNQYDRCLECSTVERNHEGHGYCTACYQRRKKHGPSVLRISTQSDASSRSG